MSEDMSADVARATIERVERALSDVFDLVMSLHEGRAWLALGYGSWIELVERELRPRLAMTKGDREVMTLALSAGGMSTRDVAAVVEMGHDTVARRVAVLNQTPATPSRMSKAECDPIILAMLDQGRTRLEIAQAIGYSPSHTGTLIAGLGRRLGDRPRRKEPPEPEPEPMHDDEPARPAVNVPRHRQHGNLLSDVREWQAQYDAERWALRACHHADHAEQHDDREWLNELRAAVEHLRADLARVIAAIEDRRFRDQQSRVGDGSPPRSALRSVQ